MDSLANIKYVHSGLNFGLRPFLKKSETKVSNTFDLTNSYHCFWNFVTLRTDGFMEGNDNIGLEEVDQLGLVVGQTAVVGRDLKYGAHINSG